MKETKLSNRLMAVIHRINAWCEQKNVEDDLKLRIKRAQKYQEKMGDKIYRGI